MNSLRIGLLPQLEIALLRLGFKEATRIDLYEGNSPSSEVKLALLEAGLKFHPMRISDNPKHVCGLSVAKTDLLAGKFAQASLQNDLGVIKEMMGVNFALPMQIPQKGTSEFKALMAIKKEAPTIYIKLIHENQIL